MARTFKNGTFAVGKGADDAAVQRICAAKPDCLFDLKLQAKKKGIQIKFELDALGRLCCRYDVAGWGRKPTEDKRWLRAELVRIFGTVRLIKETSGYIVGVPQCARS